MLPKLCEDPCHWIEINVVWVWEWNCKLTAWINSVSRFPGLFINRHFERNIKSPRREGNKELNVKGSRIQYITHEWALVSAHSNQSIVNLISAACCSWRRAVSRPNGSIARLCKMLISTSEEALKQWGSHYDVKNANLWHNYPPLLKPWPRNKPGEHF